MIGPGDVWFISNKLLSLKGPVLQDCSTGSLRCAHSSGTPGIHGACGPRARGVALALRGVQLYIYARLECLYVAVLRRRSCAAEVLAAVQVGAARAMQRAATAPERRSSDTNE